MLNRKKQNDKNSNPFPLMEEEVLNFWDKAKTFEKSLDKKAPKGDYVFYDGPPFGTGEPHYGHILSSVSKDVVPRYWTMQGYRVERRWGWDCHGLPIENIIEKQMGISGKKEIEKVGINKFNETCRSQVLEYADIWDKMIKRIGRWVDFKNSYKTMDLDYMESIWWAFKELWKKDLIYQGRKVLLYCPRCETPISNFEVAMDNSYKDIKETSIYVKFKLKNPEKLDKSLKDGNVYMLAWTTTPWTLPGNVALAVGKNIDYAKVRTLDVYKRSENGEIKYLNLIIAKDIFQELSNRDNKDPLKLAFNLVDARTKGEGEEAVGATNIIEEFKGKDLVGLEYESLFDVPALKESGKENVYKVHAADFVTTDDGTGVVHTAVVYGEDDYNLGLKLDLPVIPALDEKGHFNETVPELKGMYFKKANKKIIEDLKEKQLLFAEENISHSYPHCHRCETQLFYNAIPAWFLSISKIRERLLVENKKINWFPDHLKEGRFAKGIEQAPDWNISRNRYFATPMPIWQCEKCGEQEVIGSVSELEAKSGEKNIKDIHNHYIDNLGWECESKCGGRLKRISEVFDCWVESGSMPFAQMHYPFENKKKFENNFPAQFISEYISQTRAWFYVMHVMSVALFNSNGFENVVTTGVIFNEKGEKMSKSKKNFPDPWEVINKSGVDALRFYLMSSPVMLAENLNFSAKGVEETLRKVIMILWNVFKFYEMYANSNRVATPPSAARNDSGHILDKWILARLNQLIAEVTENMNNYNLPKATRPIVDFVNDLSTWYLRRSRNRFKGENKKDKQAALETTGYVLQELAKVMAPFTPFIAEQIWQKVTKYNFKDENKSVHLEKWPEQAKQGKRIIEEMEIVKKIVELGLAKRDEAGIRVRQPIASLKIKNQKSKIKNQILELIKDEMNVKKIEVIEGEGELSVELDTKMSTELKLEGAKREIVRFINAMRKQAGLTIEDRAIICWQSKSGEVKEVFKKFSKDIMKNTLSDEIIKGVDNADIKKDVKINKEEAVLGIKKK